jgi:hypothetical protein
MVKIPVIGNATSDGRPCRVRIPRETGSNQADRVKRQQP